MGISTFSIDYPTRLLWSGIKRKVSRGCRRQDPFYMDRCDAQNRGVRESLLGHGIVSARAHAHARELTPRWATTNLLPGSDGERSRIYRVPPVSTRQCKRPEDREDCKRLSVTRDRKERTLAYQPFDFNLESPTRSGAANGSYRDRSQSRCTYDTLRYEESHVRRYQGRTTARLKYISHVQIGIPPGLSKQQTRFCIWRFRISSTEFLPSISRARNGVQP